MAQTTQGFTIGTLAASAEVHVETIRFYQLKGLLKAPDKPYGGVRRYGDSDVSRVRFIKSAQRMGFSLGEIAELLKLDDGAQCREASALAASRLADVRRRLHDLKRMEKVLTTLVKACGARRGTVSCPLIEALHH